MINPFKAAPLPKGEKTAIGMAGYDNPRENIDPHVKTKVIDTKEIVQNGISYDLSELSGAVTSNINSLSGAFYTLSGANSAEHIVINNNIVSLSGQLVSLSGANAKQNNIFLQLSGANANQIINTGSWGIRTTGSISGANLAASSLLNGSVVFVSGAKLSTNINFQYIADSLALKNGTFNMQTNQNGSTIAYITNNNATGDSLTAGVIAQTLTGSSGFILHGNQYASSGFDRSGALIVYNTESGIDLASMGADGDIRFWTGGESNWRGTFKANGMFEVYNTISAANIISPPINQLSGGFYALSGANSNQHQTFLQLSGANANQTINIGTYGLKTTATISGGMIFSDNLIEGKLLYLRNTTSPFIYIDDGTVQSYIQRLNSNLDIRNSAGLQFSPQNAGLLYLSGAKIGIGTPTPDKPLTIHLATDRNLNCYLNSDVVALLAANDGASNYTNLKLDGTKIYLNSDSGGAVGIGTNAPDQKLHVSGTANTFLEISNTDATYGSNILIGQVSTNLKKETQVQYASNIGFYDTISGAWRFIINNGGNVGIGTTNPNYALDVNGTIGVGHDASGVTYDSTIFHSSSSPYKILTLQSIGGANGWRGAIDFNMDYSGDSIFTAMTIRTNVDNTANVGIGTTAPSQKLEVSGVISGAGVYSSKTISGMGIFIISGGQLYIPALKKLDGTTPASNGDSLKINTASGGLIYAG